MTLHSTDIERQITDLRQAITETEAEHRELAFRYSETGEKDLMDQMMKLRETVSVFRYEIEANEVARDEALKREAAEADEEAAKEILDRVVQGKELLSKRVDLAKKLEKQFERLGQVMEEFLNASEQVRQHHGSLIENDDVYGFVGLRIFGNIPQIHGWRSALSSAGLRKFLNPNYQSPIGEQTGGAAMTLSEAIQMQHDRVRYRKKVMYIINDAKEETNDA
ncbi:MAG: hypothetical protein N0E58_08950 [Candidatus Thiodiazotropha endolucinida]|uniref:Uncharacterized protein n=1 Tax=Candidatus Thiodiazotropha taylori TaxID=2792791 RepID=A0A9E4TSG5_9GAMM|nr:hypothetical protein [Candidatus Thiodiazotropha taylori]MCW4236381.1 hypothetical protein [Candidatus Thiodiazotropha endolucinida]